MLRKKWLWVGVIVVVAAIVWWQMRDTREDVMSYVVERGNVVESVSVSGQLVPVRAVDLSFEAIGTVVWVGVSIGDRVTKGQELIKLDRARLSADYAAAQQNVYKAVQEEKLQRRHWNRLKPEAREQIKANVAQARAQLSVIVVGLGKTTLTAPIDGIITLQEAQEGERVKEVGTIVRIISDDAFEIESLVPESDILDFTVDKEGVATFDAIGTDQPMDVHVTRIEPEATIIQDVVYYKVFFSAAQLTIAGDMTHNLRSGMSADVDLVMSQRDNVIKIPRRLVAQDVKGFFVMMRPTDGDDTEALRRDIVVGVQGDDGRVEIIEGLIDGEEITELITDN